MVKINVTRGSDPWGLCQYLLDKTKQVDQNVSPIIASNMCGRDQTELAEEFRFSHDLNRRVKNTMVHYALSMPPGEELSKDQIRAISKSLLQQMGHQDCQFFVVRHHDQEHKHGVQHFHIATSAVDLNGKWVDGSFERYRLKTVEQSLEHEHSLFVHPITPPQECHYLTTGEYRLKARTGKELPKEKLWNKLRQHTADQPALTTLTARLKADGIDVQFKQIGGDIVGLSYQTDGIAFPGYKLGKAYSLKGLQSYLGVTHPPQDNPQLLRLQQMSADQCRKWLEIQEEEEQKKRKQQEQQEKRKHYRSLYERYSPAPPLNQPSDKPSNRVHHDIAVAVRAFQDRQLPQDVLLIVANGVNAQELKQKQGEEAAVRYAHEIRQHAQLKLEEIQKQQDKKRKQDTRQ